MKIEKLNDNQIRCTLTKEDLADRQIRLSELAYGSDKARELFKDMISKANTELGFNAEDIPLMVEAIPVSADTIILVITKVEYPEELDTRFSRFSDPDPDLLGNFLPSGDKMPKPGASDIVDLFKQAYEKVSKEESEKTEKTENAENIETEKRKETSVELKDFARLFVFTRLEQAERLSKILYGFYHADSSLFKNPSNEKYYLTLHKGNHTPEEFNKVCNIASEYATQQNYSKASDAFFHEHGYVIVDHHAIETLYQLN
ncbi:MAG: adaptor protein MecA [Lachnospiraceae bacterium]|nr:adaptor protein MecA [Lachnospiraceae bacterium]